MKNSMTKTLVLASALWCGPTNLTAQTVDQSISKLLAQGSTSSSHSISASQAASLAYLSTAKQLNQSTFSSLSVQEVLPGTATMLNLGAGSTGGGQGSEGFLRDIMGDRPEFTCETKMSDFSKDYPTFNKTLNIIAKNNIVFASQIIGEMKKVNVCMVNGKLSSLSLGDQNGIVMNNTDFDQLALRVAYLDQDSERVVDVYIDREEFENMNSEEGKSFLLLHEVMHSFMGKTPQISYVNRLRGYIRELYQITNSGETNLEDLNKLSEQYNVESYLSPSKYINEVFRMSRNKVNKDNYNFMKTAIAQSLLSDEFELKRAGSGIVYKADYESLSSTQVIDLLKALERKGMKYSGFIYSNGAAGMTLYTSALNNYNADVTTFIIQKAEWKGLKPSSAHHKLSMSNLIESFARGTEDFNKTVLIFTWNNMTDETRRRTLKNIRSYSGVNIHLPKKDQVFSILKIK